MPFLRQLYKQKPQAWGPVSSVRDSIFKNAERIGFDPNNLLSYTPVWEGVNQARDIINSNNISEGTQNWINNSTQGMNGTTQYISILLQNPISFLSDFTLFFDFIPNLTVNGTSPVMGIGRADTSTSDINVGVSQGYASNVFKITKGITTSNYFYFDQKPTFLVIKNNYQTATGYFYNRDKFIQSLSSTTGLATAYAMGVIRAGVKPTGLSITSYQPIKEFYGCGLIKGLLNDAIVSYLADNPYYLLQRVAPVFYSVPGGAGGVTISSTTGTVIVTGYDVGIETGVTISVNTGIITGTGFNVEVEQGTSVQVTTGEIFINGLNPDIVQGIQFIVTKGMVAINSFNTTVLNGTEINVTSKNVSITGYDVEVEQGIIITSSIESIIITGYNVSVTNEFVISLNVGSVIIAGYNTTVLAGMKIDLTKAEITITGLDLEIEQGTQIDVTSETVTVTGLDVSVENALSINVTTGSVNVLGYPVNVYAGILIEATTGNVAITGYNPTVAQSSGVEVTTGQVTITGLDTTIECTVLIEPTTGMVIIASYSVTVTDGLVAETPITRTNIVAASNRVITNSGSSRLMTNSNSSRLIVIT